MAGFVRPIPLSVFDYDIELARLLDPGRDLGLARDPTDDARPCGDDLLDRDGEVRRVPLGELGG